MMYVATIPLNEVATISKQVLPKSFGSHLATPYGTEWTRPLHVLAVKYPLQMNPITQPQVCYIHTAQTDT